MNGRTLWAVARADLAERTRRYSFLATLAGTAYFGYLIHAGYVHLTLAGQRGVLNSAWVGTLTALCLGFVLPLIGFYLVKDAIDRDRRTGVGEILATTVMSRTVYTCGKALSNFLYLGAVVVVLAVAGVLVQRLSGEAARFEPGAFLVPLAGLAVPPLALVAALAVLFESVRWLRGALGDIIYFMLWNALLVAAIASPYLDLVGYRLVRDSLAQALGIPSGAPAVMTLNIGGREPAQGVFLWHGISWTGDAIAGRLAVVIAAIVLALAAGQLFGRFDPDREGQRAPAAQPARRGRRLPGRLASWSWAPRSPFLALVFAELRLMFAGRGGWWLLVAVGLVVAQLFAPFAVVRTWIHPFAWIWPLALWSEIGARERRHGTEALVFASPNSLAFQTAALWCAGFLLAAATGAGVGLRAFAALPMAPERGGPALLAWLVGCLFIPGLALALGTWSGGSRLFEIVYLLLWYLGPVNGVHELDYMGVHPGAGAGRLATFALLAVLLPAVGFAGRAWQARR